MSEITSPVGNGYVMRSGDARRAHREVSVVQADAVRARVVEHARGQLANDALMITGAVSALEGYLCEVAPLGAHRYRMIADQQALGAARAVLEFGRW